MELVSGRPAIYTVTSVTKSRYHNTEEVVINLEHPERKTFGEEIFYRYP